MTRILFHQSREEEFREALLNERAIGYLLYSTDKATDQQVFNYRPILRQLES
jgi:hypothetical protein